MGKLVLKTDPKVNDVFARYPAKARAKMEFLKRLVIETAKETEDIEEMVVTLKWGEPSFLTRIGSTLRMDWKAKTPGEYAMYFQCTSRLVDTFKSIFGNKFRYEGNRAIVFDVDQDIPVAELKECIKASLRYHKVKKLMTLGI
jgi:hypothetical protein